MANRKLVEFIRLRLFSQSHNSLEKALYNNLRSGSSPSPSTIPKSYKFHSNTVANTSSFLLASTFFTFSSNDHIHAGSYFSSDYSTSTPTDASNPSTENTKPDVPTNSSAIVSNPENVPPEVSDGDKKENIEPESVDPKPKVIFVLGGPGSGKGTQCARIVDEFGFIHLSAGDLLRAEIKSGSPNGVMIENMIKEGKIVPAEVTVGLLKQAMLSNPKANYLIDGFPRNDENRIIFEKITGIQPDFILFFDCPEEVMEKRLLGRNQGRVDDNIETIKKRFRVFIEQSMPVVDYFDQFGKVKKINATKTPDEVFASLAPLFSPYVEDEKPKVEAPPLPKTQFNPKIVFVLGGPGSGKGTQCARIVDEFGFIHLSAGDLLRAEIKSGSPNGVMIENMIKEGKIVPAEVTVGLLKQAMLSNPKANYLIDGFPRNDENRIIFEKITGLEPEFILFFDCPEEVMEKRLLGRNQGRVDDNIETIKKRFHVFIEQSMPVVGYYEKLGKVRKINATKTPDEVFSSLSPLFIRFLQD